MSASTTAPPRLALDAPVELHETHISWVFVAGERAYKVKKPIVLPFLDYGSAARRRAMCHAEVQLNRRLAPDLYLGVRSLVPAGDALHLGDDDDPAAVDYAVEMRRYREADTLAARLARGDVTSADAAAVGTRLAGFHGAAATCPGGAEPVKRALDDNFATLYGLVGDRASVTRAERSAGAQLAAAWDELEARAAAGLVRDGHGDLRLEHVLLGDRVQIVDCVEFEPGLRKIDVAADLAFLVMELREAGRRDLADALVRAYRAARGEPGSHALLAGFAAYRAEVRAKVALLRAAQLSGGTTAGQEDHAATLMALATRLRWSAHAPLVIAVAGVAASGKSTVAAALAAASGFPHVSSDIVRKRRAGIAPTDRGSDQLYTPEARRGTYAALGEIAAAHAHDGVIVDATFHERAERDAFRDATGAVLPTLFVECTAPVSVLAARARARSGHGASASDAGVEVVRRQIRAAEHFDEVAGSDHVVVRSDRPVAEIVAEISDALDRRAPASVVIRSETGSSPAVDAALL